LNIQDYEGMALIKVSSQVEEQVWLDLKEIAAESHQSLSGLVTEAIRDFVARRRVRPVVLDQLRESMDEHAELGRKLAK
jgi:predicted transcriptional regulator